MIDTNSVLGYAWPMIVSPGQAVSFHLSSATLTGAEAQVVKVRMADPDPNGPGLGVAERASAIDGPVTLRHQEIHPGSCAVIKDAPVLARLGVFSVGCLLWPTRVDARPQTLIARWRDDTQEGWRLSLDAVGRLEVVVGGS